MKYILVLIFIFYFPFIYCQEFEILNGFELYYSKVETGSPNISDKYFNNGDPIFKFRYSHCFKKLNKIPMYAQFYADRSFAHIEIRTKEDDKNWTEGIRPGIGGGSSRTRVYRIGVGAGYNFDFLESRFMVSPKLIVNFEKAVATSGAGLRTQGEVNGRYTFDTYAGSIPGNQIIPEFGMALKLRCIRGLYLFTEYSYLQGHRPNQYIEAEFFIDGVPQPKARNINDGTAHQVMAGISYDFKYKKKRR
ncbi:MAG: hypothetical protein IPN29_17545 [Saprospiraceae bacterium]|nr:hypothetical protein [Saprospiraceae bacterium]